jgi:membrane AbrB-like protein
VLAQIVQSVLALLVGAGGGIAFYLLDLPLPWVLGSIAASATLALCRIGWAFPLIVRDMARPVVGLMAGSAFTAAVARSMLDWWPAVLVIVAASLISSWAGWLYFRRLCRWEPVTAFFSAAPGGLSELTLLGASYGGNLRTIAMVHSLRIVVVVFSVPFILELLIGHPLTRGAGPLNTNAASEIGDWAVLAVCGVAGYLIGKIFRVPGGVMLPALILSALAHVFSFTEATAPWWLVAAVQIVIGSSAGSRFYGVTWRELSTTVVQSVIWALILVGVAFAAAFASSIVFDIPIAALVLAYAPGGMAEMSIMAFILGTEVAFVVCCQVARIIFVYLSMPTIFRIARIGPPSQGTTGGAG